MIFLKKKNLFKKYISSHRSNIFFFLLAIPLILLIIIVSPLIKIKICELQSRKIGAFSSSIEIYLSEIKLKLLKIKINEFHLFYCNHKISNEYILNHWKKNLIILPRIVLEPIFFFFKSSIYFQNFIVNLIDVNIVNKSIKKIYLPKQTDVNDVLSNTRTSIEFTHSDSLSCQKILNDLGLKINQKIICFANRDELFLKENFISKRNAKINTYKNAIKYLANKDFFCIRMGKKQAEKINFLQENIIDYPVTDQRSDIMDLFIFSKCIFLISTSHGVAELAPLFRKKRLIINYSFPQYLHWLGNHTPFVIPKKFKKLNNNEFISFKEVYEKKLYLISNTDLNSYGFELVDNSEEEILDATKDMYELYNNDFKIELSDQKKFWSLYEKYFGWRPNRMMIGKTFFKKNYNLFI
jgi:putative glycosyltransferase (TIGR04372 family)